MGIAVFFVAAGLAVMGSGRLFSTNPSRTQVPNIVVSPADLDFGVVWENERFVWTIEVENREPETIEIDGVTTTCNCSSSDSNRITIPAGRSERISLVLNLLSSCNSAQPEALSTFQTMIRPRVHFNGETKELEWKLIGKVRRAMAVASKRIDFGSIDGSYRAISRNVPVLLLGDTASVSVMSSNPSIIAKYQSNRTGHASIDVTVESGLPTGHHSAILTLSPILNGSTSKLVRRLPVEIDVLPEIQFDSHTATIGAGEIGEKLTGLLTVRSVSRKPFTILKWNTDSPECVVTINHALSSNNNYTFHVEELIASIGNHVSKLIVQVLDSDGIAQTIEADIRHYGIESHP